MNSLLSLFAPPAPAPAMKGTPEEVHAAFKRWQMRILLSTMLGYILFYFVRKNISFAMPGLGKDMGITKSDLGLFLTLHGVIYGVSRFVNGALADRTNARMLMVSGLILCALMNLGFGWSASVLSMGVFWMLNGWVQGMGFPPCARLMAHWFEPRELATKQSIWNTSHSIGAGLVAILCGYLAMHSWQLCFSVPAVLAIMGSFVLWMTLRDTPPSLGLPEVKGTEGASPPDSNSADHRHFLRTSVFGNRYIWLLALANFFVYIVRYGVLDWGPTFLNEAKHIELKLAGWMMAAFEGSGVLGMLLAGWVTDKVFGGRGARTCVFYMAGAGLAMLALWQLNPDSRALNTILLCVAGFFIYGPQALIGIAVANLATKRGAATAAGFTGLIGYFSTIYTGWGLGKVVETYGWNTGLMTIVVASVLGTLLFLATWPSNAHGYRLNHGDHKIE
ncbi:MAG: MFS transporter [Verrucomicrobiaceae bacterium]|nr:MFS transporter [Verrucomicrobiaceae bacterium]